MSKLPEAQNVSKRPELQNENELTAKAKAYLDRAFTYHAPKPLQPIKYQILRAKAKELATEILKLCPDQIERDIALMQLESAVMFANASIARWE